MAAKSPNSQYNVAAPDSLAIRLAGRQRRLMYDRFIREFGVEARDTILDVGATSDRSYDCSNYLEAWHPHKDRITACGVDDAAFLEEIYPGVRFVPADGLALPFDDRSFDFIHSSAVLEHVGSFENQVRFIDQCARVAGRGLFLTTPNRWFPVEFHTGFPIVHWLPPRAFRGLMRRSGRAFFADEANLNLLSARSLRAAAAAAPHTARFRLGIATVPLAGWPSNLLLIGRAAQ